MLLRFLLRVAARVNSCFSRRRMSISPKAPKGTTMGPAEYLMPFRNVGIVPSTVDPMVMVDRRHKGCVVLQNDGWISKLPDAS